MLNLAKKSIFILAAMLLNINNAIAETTNTYNLEQAIDYALQNNPNLQIMQQRIAQAEAQLGMVVSAFYPNIMSRLTYEHTTNPSRAFGMIIAQRRLNFAPTTNFNNPGGTDNYRPEISAQISLFRGGQDYFQSKAAKFGIEAATLEKSAARNQLIKTVSSTFYAYLAAIEADKITDRSIDAVKKELQHSQNRYQAGTVLKSDLLSLQVQLAQAQDNKIQSANAIELAKTGLKTLLGINAAEAFEINSSENWQLPEDEITFESLLETAIQQRPEILSVAKRIQIAQQQLNAARGAYLPKADAYVSYGSDSKNLDYSGNLDNFTAGVMLEMDIFSGFHDSERIKKAEHELAIAEKIAKQMQLAIENEVKSSHLKVQEALARIKVTASSVLAAEEAFRLVNEQRKAGVVTVTRYIEAEVARDKSHARNIAARYDALRAQVELNQAIGFWK